VWTRWYANGGMQAQAEFRDGLQHGFQIEWDESGRRKREIRFVEGKPVGR
jgi:antitoxin component YwqK of YwqJK toxin-antitoxin module